MPCVREARRGEARRGEARLGEVGVSALLVVVVPGVLQFAGGSKVWAESGGNVARLGVEREREREREREIIYSALYS